MFYRSSQFFLSFALIFTFALFVSAQQDPSASVLPKPPNNDDHPKSFRETLEKMRIDKEKRDFQEMLDRGAEVLKITEELEKTVEKSGNLTERDHAKVVSVEKLVKKIRGGLGGDDEEDENQAREDVQKSRLSPGEAVKSLRKATIALLDELKKTTRFSISAAAIQSSNAVLRVARFLKLTN